VLSFYNLLPPAKDNTLLKQNVDTLSEVQAALALFNRIDIFRAGRRPTGQNLADALGIHYQTLVCLERGDHSPCLDLALRIREFSGLPVERMFSREPFRPGSEELARVPSHQAGPV
jgi:DNA-binding XRE family transcriptional regulator